MKVLICVLSLAQVASCLRCYSGSGMKKVDELPFDYNTAWQDNSVSWNQWFYRTTEDNCQSCTSLELYQNPGSNYATHPTVLVQMTCNKRANVQCSIDQRKYQADLDYILNLNPHGYSQSFLSEVRNFAEDASKNILPWARTSCSTCDTEGCMPADFPNVPCTVGYGHNTQQCSTGHVCYIETPAGDVNSKYRCQSSCSRQALGNCCNPCNSVYSNSQSLCWCDDHYHRLGWEPIITQGSPPSSIPEILTSFVLVIFCQVFCLP